jgi:hypothetical protein
MKIGSKKYLAFAFAKKAKNKTGEAAEKTGDKMQD